MTSPSDDTDRVRRRLERLVRAGVQLNAERSLERLLQAIVDSSRDVLDARYAALGVLDAAGTGLSNFVVSGLDPELHASIGSLPTGKGILGVLIREPTPLRLPDLTRHPQSHGFPPSHPHMTSFLGVPIVGRAGPIGNLYLTEKLGSAEFSDEDEAIAVMLAAQAGVAVENARLHEHSARLVTELQELQTSRDRFYAMINHELRNALTAVFGWAELLIRRLGPEAPRAAREVYESAERTLVLVNDLLDMSRLDASRLQLNVRPADAWALVVDAVKAVEPAAGSRRIRLQPIGPGASTPCRTDPQRVRQVLVNLLTNAVRHSPEDETVRIELQAADRALRFDVVDRGPGIAPEDQSAIFEAFVQAGSEHRGTGLGLTLSRRLARLLGGELRVESALGQGARFILEVPRESPKPEK